MSWQPDPHFFSVPKHSVRLSAADVDFPILYTDASSTSVFYGVDLRKASALLEPHGLAPARGIGGRAVLGITWFEYRATSIGPYNELGISLLAAPGIRPPKLPLLRVMAGDPRLGFFVLHLPVTTELARVGGVEVYGYPKTVNELPISLSDRALHGSLLDDGHAVLEMHVPLGRGVTVRMIDLSTYSVRQGCLLRTIVPTDSQARLIRSPDTSLSLRSLEHPIARTIRELAPDPRPRAVLHVPQFRSRLPLPVPERRAR
jgi:hypothetical protein